MKLEFDVAVFGAGLAGVAASVGALRSGKKVILVEQSFTVGGNSTAGLVNPFMRFWLNDRILAGEFFVELLEELSKRGGLHENAFDSELLKIVLLEKLGGVQLLFRTVPIGVRKSGRRIESVDVVTSLGNRYEIDAELYVDATGDGTLAYLAGCGFESGDENGENQAITLMFVLGNVDFNVVRESVRKEPENFFAWVSPDSKVLSVGGYFKEIARAKADGLKFPNEYFFFNQLPGDGRVSVNTTHLHVKTTDDLQLSNAVSELHSQVYAIYDFAKRYVPGFERTFIEKIAPLVGIRESRRVHGVYKFSGRDVTEKRKFPNAVVKACYGIDVHKKDTTISEDDRRSIPVYEDYYEIPVTALISKEFENLAIVGRCFSADFLGHSAARIMPTCTDMGAAIGKLVGMVGESFYEILT